MIKEQSDIISKFIDDLLLYKLQQLKFNCSTKRNVKTYSIDIDTGVPIKTSNNLFGMSFGNQYVHFSVSDNGNIVFTRDDYDGFYSDDKILSSKYFKILESYYIKRQCETLNKIVDSGYSDLNLRRQSNLGKLI